MRQPQNLQSGPVRPGGLRQPPPAPPRPATHPADDEMLVMELVDCLGERGAALLLRAFGGFDVPVVPEQDDGD